MNFIKKKLDKIVSNYNSKSFELTEKKYGEGEYALELLQRLSPEAIELGNTTDLKDYCIYLHSFIATLSAPIFSELYSSFIEDMNNELNIQESNILFKNSFFEGLIYKKNDIIQLTNLYVQTNNPSWDSGGIGLDPCLPHDCINYILTVFLEYEESFEELVTQSKDLKLQEFLKEYIEWLSHLDDNDFQTPHKDEVIRFISMFYEVKDQKPEILIQKEDHDLPVIAIKKSDEVLTLSPTEAQWELLNSIRDYYPDYVSLKKLASIIYKDEIEDLISSHQPPLEKNQINSFKEGLCSSAGEFCDNIKKRKRSLDKKIKSLDLDPNDFIQSRTKHGYRLKFKF